ncbi:hypothetical protein B0H10DRAFT_1945250 [Mycena sp. CBHHK59/15]|nr:hypothetical protein B0H10DRAFT_1945250 [Mycena sp. CBHHK59/15]
MPPSTALVPSDILVAKVKSFIKHVHEQLDVLMHQQQFWYYTPYIKTAILCMPILAHELAHGTLCRWNMSEVDTQSGTPFGGLLTCRSVTYTFPYGSKESDSSITPSENNPGQLLSIIIECGLSESYVHIKGKAKGWLNDCTLIVVKIYVATKQFVIELWTRDVTT